MKNLQRKLIVSLFVVGLAALPGVAFAQNACTPGLNCYGRPHVGDAIPAFAYGIRIARANGVGGHEAIHEGNWQRIGVELTYDIYGSTAESRMVQP